MNIDREEALEALAAMRAAVATKYAAPAVAAAAQLMLAEAIGQSTDDRGLAISVAVQTGIEMAATITLEWSRLQAAREMGMSLAKGEPQ